MLEPLNRKALRLAQRVADSPYIDGAEPDLLAGNISNTNLWNPDDPDSQREVRAFAEEAWNLGVKYLGVCCGVFQFISAK